MVHFHFVWLLVVEVVVAPGDVLCAGFPGVFAGLAAFAGDAAPPALLSIKLGNVVLGAGVQFAPHDDSAFGEGEPLPYLGSNVPACLFQSRGDELGADVPSDKAFLFLFIPFYSVTL